jgi:hypothetical protein
MACLCASGVRVRLVVDRNRVKPARLLQRQGWVLELKRETSPTTTGGKSGLHMTDVIGLDGRSGVGFAEISGRCDGATLASIAEPGCAQRTRVGDAKSVTPSITRVRLRVSSGGARRGSAAELTEHGCPSRRARPLSGARQLDRQAPQSSPRPHAETPRRHLRAR